MNPLPFDSFCIITALKPDEVEAQLQREVAPGFSFRTVFDDIDRNKYFTGVAENGKFKMMRIIRNRNSFLPVIIGHTEDWLNGSRIYVKMRLHLFVAVFMCLWLGGACIGGMVMAVNSIMNNKFSPVVLAPFGMLLFGYAMMIGFYSYERNKAKEILLWLLNGQIDNTAVE